jgi:PAS domain S-box-containing protein
VGASLLERHRSMDISQFFTIGLDRSQAMTATYDLSLVLASYLIAALAGYAFLRLTTLIAELSKPASRLTWMVAGALTMGLGTWAMHFVAMLAYRLPVPVGYDPTVTAISLVPAVLGSGVALHVVARRTVTLQRLLLGGVLMGAGIGTMHYTGMAAMRFDALVRYDPLLFATSIVVAVALAFIALSVTFWTVTRRNTGPSLAREAVGAGIMGLAVAGMHYTAMTSTLCFAEPGLHLSVLSIDPKVFAAVTTAVAVAILVIAIIAVIFDRRLDAEITRRKSAADRARRMDERLMDAIETMPDSLAVFDPDETLILCNSLFSADYGEAADILVPGVRFEDIMRRRIDLLWPHESAEGKAERLAKHLQGFRDPGLPLVSRARNGGWSLIRERRTVDGGIVRVETDITAVKEAEELATLREQRLTLIMNNVADALLTLDLDGNIESFNRSAEIIFGYAAGEVIGRNVTMLMAEQERAGHVEGLRKRAAGEAATPGRGAQEVIGVHKSGRKISTELVITKACEGERTIFIVALRDVTERRAIQAQLQQAQKMEAVGQLTGGIAHDFNNLLGVIIGNLDLLKEKVAARSEEDSLIGAALDFALRGAELNKRLLAFSRRQSLQPERIDVNEVLAGMTVLLTRAVSERVAIQLHPGRQVWPINVDLTQLESALLNLTVNARDAMPEGGTLTIETARTVIDDDHMEHHAGMAAGEYVCISVADDGVGMTPEVQARVFEPFFTTKPIGAGSGLGLSMVFGFIKQSDGYVTIYSEPGRGTVVRLYLPRATPLGTEATEATERYEADRAAASPTGTETVLVVEDNEGMARIAMKQLQDLGYRVIERRNAAEALTLIAGETPIDLLFTDVVMPGAMDGIALAHKAITLRPDLKILLTSGFPQRATAVPGKAGEVALPALLLTKPYRKQHLAMSVRQALDQPRNQGRTS